LRASNPLVPTKVLPQEKDRAMSSPFAVMTPEQRQAASEAAKVARQAKADRMAASPTLDVLRTRYPEHAGRIDAMATGSLKAAVTVMCVTCSGGSYHEAKQCTAIGCPLFEHRPQ
jgi:hypothetical protein